MHCANPNCRMIADDLMKGTLKLLELETPPDDRILFAAGGFPVCSARTRYFWLCDMCSRHFTIRKWNASGLLLEPFPTQNNLHLDPQLFRKPASAVSLADSSSEDRLCGTA